MIALRRRPVRSPRPAWRRLVLVLAFGLPLLASSGCAYARLTSLLVDNQKVRTGPILVQRQGADIEVKVNMSLEPGDMVETQAGTHATIEFRDGTEVMMFPETKVQISSLRHFFGKIWASVTAKRSKPFVVERPGAKAIVGGTEFLMEAAGPAAPLELTVLEGAVRLVPTRGGWTSCIVRQGERVIVNEGVQPEPRKLASEELRRTLDELNDLSSIARNEVVVPDVRGLDVTAAEGRLAQARLRRGKVRKVLEGGQIGNVVRQKPAAFAHARVGTAVQLWERIESQSVPDLNGLSEREARTRLADRGLGVDDVKRKFSKGKRPPLKVYDTKPEADTLVPVGTKVRLYVEKDWVQTPSVIGLLPAEAVQRIAGAGLRPKLKKKSTENPAEQGTILDQDPEATEAVERRERVKLYVGVLKEKSDRPPPDLSWLQGLADGAFKAWKLEQEKEQGHQERPPNRPPQRPQASPDLAAARIEFKLLRKTGPTTGRVRITGVVKNVGRGQYQSRAGQQSAQLFEGGKLVAEKPFLNLAAGAEFKVSYDLDWNTSREFPASFVLQIFYRRDITSDGNPQNDDGNSKNNRTERTGIEINTLFLPQPGHVD